MQQQTQPATTKDPVGYRCYACNDSGLLHPDCKLLFPDFAQLFRGPSDYGQGCQNCGERHRYSYGLRFDVSQDHARILHQWRLDRIKQAYAAKAPDDEEDF